MAEDTNQKPFQDPDYTSVTSSPRKNILSEEQKIERVRKIIEKEFSAEIAKKEKDIDIIDQRLLLAKKTLHRLRYAIVNRYYSSKQLQLSEEDVRKEIVSQKDPIARAKVHTLLRDEQKRIHPALKKLLGKQSDVNLDDLFKIRPPRKRNKTDLSPQASTSENITICVDDSTETLRTHVKSEFSDDRIDVELSQKKIPRYVEPKDMEKNIIKIDTAIRNKQKEKFRIIIGNTSKYTPPHSEMDRSTHRWLLYVRGTRDKPDISHFVESVTVKLDSSYAPHNIIKLTSSPFHLSRRGWGEFAVNLQMHFKNERLNKPVNLTHNLKLDRNYTGTQTLGGETVVDVWLYPDETMSEKERELSSNTDINEEPRSHSRSDHFNVTTIKQEIEEDSQVDFENAIDNANVISESKKSHSYKNVGLSTDAYIKLEPMDMFDGNTVISHESSETSGTEQNKVLDVRIVHKPAISSSRIQNNVTFKSPVIAKDGLPASNKKIKCLVKTHPNSLLKIFDSSEPEDYTSNVRKECHNELIVANNHSITPNIEVILEDHCYVKEEDMLRTFLGINLNSYGSPLLTNSTPHVVDIGGCKNKAINVVMSLINFFNKNIPALDDVRSAISMMLKRMPLIHEMADIEEFQRMFPYTVRSEDEFFKLHFIKRRNLEWTRAKIIRDFLKSHWLTLSQNQSNKLWSVKQIILYSHYHGYFPVKKLSEIENKNYEDKYTDTLNQDMLEHSLIRQDKFKLNAKFEYASQINSLSNMNNYYMENIKNQAQEQSSDSVNYVFNSVACEHDIKSQDIESSDEEIDICDDVKQTSDNKKQCPVKSPEKKVNQSIVLPFTDYDEKLMCSYIEKICAKQGIELRNEDIGNGYSDSLVHKTILSAVKSLIEDILRRSLAVKMTALEDMHSRNEMSGSTTKVNRPLWERSECGLPNIVSLRHVYEAITTRQELDLLTNCGLGTLEMEYTDKL